MGAFSWPRTAGGAVEAEFNRLSEALEDCQRLWDESVSSVDVTDQRERAAGFRMHVTSASLLHAHFAFCNVLSWTRAVEERVDRQYKPGIAGRSGLLPALADGPRLDRVALALTAFRTRLPERRFFANYVLHSSAQFQGGSASAEVLSNGRLVLRLPDAPTRRILGFEEFTFTQQRDMLTYASGVLDAVTEFIEAILAAFEEHMPERFHGSSGREGAKAAPCCGLDSCGPFTDGGNAGQPPWAPAGLTAAEALRVLR